MYFDFVFGGCSSWQFLANQDGIKLSVVQIEVFLSNFIKT